MGINSGDFGDKAIQKEITHRGNRAQVGNRAIFRISSLTAAKHLPTQVRELTSEDQTGNSEKSSPEP